MVVFARGQKTPTAKPIIPMERYLLSLFVDINAIIGYNTCNIQKGG